MKKLVLLVSISFLLFSNSKSATLENKVLAKVGNDEITYGRLEAAFQKNMSGEKEIIRT